MAIEKSCNQISLVAIDIAGFAAPYEIAQQSFGDFRIGIGSEGLAKHGGRNCHVQQMQPAIHPRERVGQLTLGMAQGVLVETARNRHVAAKRIPQELLVEALDRRQNR